MLIGEYNVALGDKNRIALPKKLRDSLNGEDLIVTRGYEGCALLLDKQRWKGLLDKINESSLFLLSVRDTKRYLLAGASDIQADKQGRFVIPDYLLQHIAFEGGELAVIGVGEWVEIWSSTKWQDKVKYLAANAADIAEKLIEVNK